MFSIHLRTNLRTSKNCLNTLRSASTTASSTSLTHTLFTPTNRKRLIKGSILTGALFFSVALNEGASERDDEKKEHDKKINEAVLKLLNIEFFSLLWARITNKVEFTETEDPLNILTSALVPWLKRYGTSVFIGAASAAACKYVTRKIAVGLGLGCIGLQALESSGYININKDKIIKDIEKIADVNGDGKVDKEDALFIVNKSHIFIKDYIKDAVAYSIGFGIGFVFF